MGTKILGITILIMIDQLRRRSYNPRSRTIIGAKISHLSILKFLREAKEKTWFCPSKSIDGLVVISYQKKALPRVIESL
jgi:hypothetical protein